MIQSDRDPTAAGAYFEIQPVGDTALAVELGDTIDLAVNRRVHALAGAIAQAAWPGIVECAPTYRSLLIHYDPLKLDFDDLSARLRKFAPALIADAPRAARLVEAPTYYGGPHGFDLDWIADACGLSTDEVIKRHSQVDYTVYMMGFTPGYPYLGKLDPALTVTRLSSPRQLVPGGSVGIAGLQTGIYPFDSPGGWRILGWTPLKLFDPQRQPPFLLAPGDRVRFAPAGLSP